MRETKKKKLQEDIDRWNFWATGGAARQRKLASLTKCTPKSRRIPQEIKKNSKKKDSVRKKKTVQTEKEDGGRKQMNIKEMILRIETENRPNKTEKLVTEVQKKA